MRIELLHTNVDSYRLTEYDDAHIELQKLDSHQRLVFKDRQEMYELLDQIFGTMPPMKINLEGKYLGEPWKYDKF